MKERKKIGNLEKHRKYYSKVARLYFRDGLGYLRISKIIPVSTSTVKNWCITFAAENGLKMERRVIEMGKSTIKKEVSKEVPKDIKSLQAEVLRLEKELKKERLRADAFDTMIDIAETKFNIPIRKKAGAKR